MKRIKLKKKSKQPISGLKRKLELLCKLIMRKQYPNVCYTCGQTGLIGSNWQTGHVPWPKSVLGAYLKYDLRVIRPQCWLCNIHHGGMGAEAYIKMLEEIGEEKMAQLQKDRQVTVKAYDHYMKLISEYEDILKNLQ